MIIIVIGSLIILYVVELIIFRIGLAKTDRVPFVENYQPMVSVIVAARNEEDFIGECISSLLQIDYPKNKLEIIIVNDGSTDRTAEIIESFRTTHPEVTLLTASFGSGNLRGKANALSQGIEQSTGTILMFTDADCQVQPAWVKETVKYFTPNVGIVGGFTILDAHRSFEGMQMLDWIFLFGLASATAGWKKPLTIIGNNLSMTREAYDATGGYTMIAFSVTEDCAIVQAILTRTKYSVRFPVNSQTVVTSRACQSLSHLYRQKQRWGVGGLDMPLFGFMIMAIGWVAKSALILGILFYGVTKLILLAAIMALAEIMFLWMLLRSFHAIKYLKYFPVFFFYLFVYVILLPFVAITSKRILWKERKL